MIHSDEKVRQMARSLLPSKNREAARSARARLHRAARREIHQELAEWTKSGDLEADPPTFAPWEAREIRDAVNWRRGGDKVNPFIRWATVRTRELRREDRLSHVRSLVSKGVIGEHALGHLEDTAAFRDPVEAAWRNRYWLRHGQRRGAGAMDRGEQAQLLRALLEEADGQRTLNRFLRERHPWPRTLNHQSTAPCHHRPRALPQYRPLLGAHDVLPFLDSLEPHARGRYSHAWGTLTPPVHWMRLFLQRFKEHRGHIPSVRAALEAEGVLTPLRPPRPSPQRAGAAGATWAPFSSLTTRVAP